MKSRDIHIPPLDFSRLPQTSTQDVIIPIGTTPADSTTSSPQFSFATPTAEFDSIGSVQSNTLTNGKIAHSHRTDVPANGYVGDYIEQISLSPTSNHSAASAALLQQKLAQRQRLDISNSTIDSVRYDYTRGLRIQSSAWRAPRMNVCISLL